MKKPLLDVIFMSEKRKNALLLLQDGPKEMEFLLKSFDTTRQAFLPQVRILEEHHLVSHDRDTYELTTIGKLIVDEMTPLIDKIEVLDTDIDYWGTHQLDFIPPYLLARINELGGCKIINPPLIEYFHDYTDFYEASKKSKSLFKATTFFYSKDEIAFSELVARNVRINIIITSNLLERMQTNKSAIFAELIKDKKLHLYVYPKEMGFLSLSYNDHYTKIRFLKNDGDFDNKFLLCSNPESFKWVKEMFEHYLKEATPITEL
ncbi:MAG: winged helix-turn-helix domain-containing protein [Methanolobus sp.]|uniref:helix-turn-helix transcriptional regulator n=1 Tax=Methanolobus sp. TaxID=1874737 RepID=UPI002731D2D8|nr:winged helix-turn-helix domain-containing protein [Methanolobus sp.]MDP2216982.1 winged helix-turn-helix domain-containing protein [Methanolobus sp.]